MQLSSRRSQLQFHSCRQRHYYVFSTAEEGVTCVITSFCSSRRQHNTHKGCKACSPAIVTGPKCDLIAIWPEFLHCHVNHVSLPAPLSRHHSPHCLQKHSIGPCSTPNLCRMLPDRLPYLLILGQGQNICLWDYPSPWLWRSCTAYFFCMPHQKVSQDALDIGH